MPEGHLDEYGGQIGVRLGVAEGRVASVDIVSTRPQGASRVFLGRTPTDVASMVGRLFSLCGLAQTIAALQAMEAAMNLNLSPAQRAARDVLRLAEILSQTAMRLGLDWPRLLDVAPERALVRTALLAETKLERALFGGAGWKTPGGMTCQPDLDAARQAIVHLKNLIDAAVFTNGLAQQLCFALGDAGLNHFGETGEGLRARLDTRLQRLAALPDEMFVALDHVAPELQGTRDAPKPDGQGLATVETARGPLTHRVDIQDGRVRAYDIHAPTDENFLPGGPVAKGLMEADASRLDALKRAAELYVLAVDPCVRFTLEIAEGADA